MSLTMSVNVNQLFFDIQSILQACFFMQEYRLIFLLNTNLFQIPLDLMNFITFYNIELTCSKSHSM